MIDAVALREDERRAFAAVAAEAGVPFTGLWLDAPGGQADGAGPGAQRRRLRRIAGNRRAAARPTIPASLDWTRIDAGAGPDATLAAARRALFH